MERNRILSTQQLSALKADLKALLEQHGLSAAYLVCEYPTDSNKGKGCAIASAEATGVKASELVKAMCEATGKMLLGAGIPKAPIVSDN